MTSRDGASGQGVGQGLGGAAWIRSATVVYRLEVGGALFLGFYLVAMAFVLALQNRGFTEYCWRKS